MNNTNLISLSKSASTFSIIMSAAPHTVFNTMLISVLDEEADI